MSKPRYKGFNLDGFYAAIKFKATQMGKDWKQVSTETGISTSTLSRMAQGKMPDGGSLAVLAAWADINLSDYVPQHIRGVAQYGARPLTKEELEALRVFRESMTAIVIPEIVKVMRMREESAQALRSTDTKTAAPLIGGES